MSVVILDKNRLPAKEEINSAKKHYNNYLKITIDIVKEIVAIGGEYHVDAEQIMIKNYNCKQKNIWGGGYELDTGEYRTDAMINVRPFHKNSTMIIRDPEIERKFLQIAKDTIENIKFIL